MKVLTQNLWFDAYERQARMEGHIEQWRRLNPDVVAVQEATLACLRPLLASEWIQAGWSSVSLESDAGWQGVAVFARRPPLKAWITPLPGSMGRRLLNVQFDDLHLGVVHLESTGGAAPVRARQLQEVFEHLAGSRDALLVGDFNFCSSSEENRILPGDYLDLWPHLHPDQPGLTHDTQINVMMLKQFRKEKFARYDRMLLRSPCWKAATIERVGTAPLRGELFASDHFGLCAQLEKRDRGGS